MENSYEIRLTVSRVKDEHVTWTVMAVEALSRVLTLDGTDIGLDISVERNRDGIERFAEFYQDDDGLHSVAVDRRPAWTGEYEDAVEAGEVKPR